MLGGLCCARESAIVHFEAKVNGGFGEVEGAVQWLKRLELLY
jgi:hypothetical protein